MKTANVVLALLEMIEFLVDGLLDEDAACVLQHDRLLILKERQKIHENIDVA